MESTLFTVLSTNEEENLSGGFYQPVGDINTNVGIQLGYNSQQNLNQVAGRDNDVYVKQSNYSKKFLNKKQRYYY